MMSQVVAMSEDSPSSLQTVAKHAEHVYSVAEGATPRPWIENVSDSSLRTKTAKASSPDQIPPREATHPWDIHHIGAGIYARV
jgi:hypothetical protein